MSLNHSKYEEKTLSLILPKNISMSHDNRYEQFTFFLDSFDMTFVFAHENLTNSSLIELSS